MIGRLCWKNLKGRPGRTAAMLLLAGFLSFSIFGGSLMIQSLQKGLGGLRARLGADVIVVPSSARSQFNIDDILMQGSPGYFYMSADIEGKIAAREGVERVSSQVYLASVTASCCSASVQLIGFDPETDFTIQPWAEETYGGALGDGELLAGSDVSVPVSGVMTFFGVDCHVAAKLSKTGSTLDSAVYANRATLQALIAASEERGLNRYEVDPDRVISTVLVKVAEGYDIEAVKNDINIHVRKVTAARASNMISGIAENLEGISRLIGLFVAVIWALCLVIMMIAFTLLMQERKKEFAVLRVMGAARGRLAGLVTAEAVLLCLLGGCAGVALAALAVFPFSRAIEGALGLPFVAPGGGRALLLALLSLAACAAVGALISGLSAARISRLDTSLILREGNG